MSALRVLVAEDDRKTSALLRLYLENAGFSVTIGETGKRALEEARSSAPDLVLLDVLMPEVNGFSVCRALRAESDVPIILLTARSTEGDKLHGLNLGADDYVTKPFSPREVVARVRAVLRRRGLPKAAAPAGPLRSGALVLDSVMSRRPNFAYSKFFSARPTGRSRAPSSRSALSTRNPRHSTGPSMPT